MKIYKCKAVMEVQRFYGPLIMDYSRYPRIKQHLYALAERMWEGIQVKHPWILQEFSNYHPEYLEKSSRELGHLKLNFEDCLECVASQYGYSNWSIVDQLETEYDEDFQDLVNFIIHGQIDKLKSSLSNNPRLLSQESGYGHRANLIHYLAANGVEMWRQQVPLNSFEILVLLNDLGVDLKATMKVYDGNHSFEELLLSSDHAVQAGVVDTMSKLLEYLN